MDPEFYIPEGEGWWGGEIVVDGESHVSLEKSRLYPRNVYGDLSQARAER